MLSLTADVQQELLLHLCLVLPALGFIRCGQAALQGELLSRKCAVQQVTALASEVDVPVLQGAWEGGRGVTALLCQLQPSGVTMGIVCLTPMALMASGWLQLCDNQLTAPPAPRGHPQLLTAGKCRNPGCRVQMWVGNHTDRPCVLGQVHSYGPAVRDVLGEAEPAELPQQLPWNHVQSWRPSANTTLPLDQEWNGFSYCEPYLYCIGQKKQLQLQKWSKR